MKRSYLLIVLLLAMSLSACAFKTNATPTVSPGDINTQVVETLTAIASLATPTFAPSPSATPTELPSPTVSAATATPPPAATAPANPPVTQAPTSGGCDNYVYVSDVTIPDDTVLAPGQTFTKTWKIQNTGTCTWTTSYKLVSFAGTIMGGAATAISASVLPGAQIDVSVALTAPTSVGTYTGYWRLQNASGSVFGQGVYVKIVVSSSAATITPSATATGGTPATSTVSATQTLTPTVGPTQTLTRTPAPTSTPTPPMTISFTPTVTP